MGGGPAHRDSKTQRGEVGGYPVKRRVIESFGTDWRHKSGCGSGKSI